MKIITSDMPKYTAVFSHPDDNSVIYDFFVDLEGRNEPWTDEEIKEYDKDVIKMVWDKYDKYRYYHTLNITAEYVIDDKVYRPTIFDGSYYEIE